MFRDYSAFNFSSSVAFHKLSSHPDSPFQKRLGLGIFKLQNCKC